MPWTVNHPYPPKFDPVWCNFRLIPNLYKTPSGTSRLEELSRILQKKSHKSNLASRRLLITLTSLWLPCHQGGAQINVPADALARPQSSVCLHAQASWVKGLTGPHQANDRSRFKPNIWRVKLPLGSSGLLRPLGSRMQVAELCRVVLLGPRDLHAAGFVPRDVRPPIIIEVS